MAVSSFNKDKLLESVRRGNWSTVIEIYKKYPEESQAVKTPKSGDTALHIAAASGEGYAVERLVSVCREEALAIGNERGDTPLHVAAQDPSPGMCQCIAEKNSNLIGSCNQDGETPLFVAVSRGRLRAFIALSRICKENQHEYAYCRRKNGDTILHSAISQQHFKMAFYIIEVYPKLVHMVNEDGMSPLHLLATESSCFASGTHLFGLRKLIYHCISVSKLRISPEEDDVDDEARFSANLLQKWYCSCIISLDDAIDRLKANRTEYHQRDEEAATEQGNQTRFEATASRTENDQQDEEAAKDQGVRNVKQRCVWSVQVMNKLLSKNAYKQHGMCPLPETMAPDEYKYLADISPIATTQMETPLLLAAKNGVLEMVEAILRDYPDAILEENSENKNIVMLAVGNRHLPLYKFLLKDQKIMRRIFGGVDKDGNSVLHIAAKLGGDQRPWRMRGAALEMYMEFKWYKFVKHSMPRGFFVRHNNNGHTPGQIFKDTHQKLMDESRDWMTKYSNSASLVSALIATVAFPASATIPGGVQQDSGSPTLEDDPIFVASAISSLLALCFSLISLVVFMVIPTSSFRKQDFRRSLPLKLLVGLMSLFLSIVFMLVSFCTGQYFVLKDKLKHRTIQLYAICCLPVIVFIISQFLSDLEMLLIALKKDPQHQQHK